MKILLLSVTAGGGHNAVAKAMEEYLQSRDVECETIDTLSYINKALGKLVADGYLFVAKDMKKVYSDFYTLMEKRHANPDKMSPERLLFSALIPKVEELLKGYQPDVIIYSHVFVGQILDEMRVLHKLPVPAVGILTDFVCHPYWEECIHLDYVVTANELLYPQMQAKGYPEEKIKPLGIPVGMKFAKTTDKAGARRALGLAPDKKTVLLMGGSMGYGDIEKTVLDLDALPVDFQLIVVCGSNEKQHEKIATLQTKKTILNLGYVHNVDELMDASDFIITKPGGITTSEALAKRLPMIIVNPIPGQEVRNTEFLTANGAAITLGRDETLAQAVHTLLTDDDKHRALLEAIDAIRKPNAAQDVCEFAITLAGCKKSPDRKSE